MGMRIQCAQCHNHPFDQWTQDDYYSFASFFSQIGRKRAADPRESIIYNRKSGEINHPIHNKPLPPKFLGGEAPEIKRGSDRRAVMADWLASPENPFFARNLANIVWAHFFGKGIIEPVDDVRVSNPPSNPQLLDELAKRFTDYNYDFKKLVRDVCNSRTYQLSAPRPNRTRTTCVTSLVLILEDYGPKSFWTQFHKSPRPRTNSRACLSEPRPFRSQTEESAITFSPPSGGLRGRRSVHAKWSWNPAFLKLSTSSTAKPPTPVSNRARSSRNYSRKEKARKQFWTICMPLLFPQAESCGKSQPTCGPCRIGISSRTVGRRLLGPSQLKGVHL